MGFTWGLQDNNHFNRKLTVLSFFKLECLKIKYHLNHFALRMKLLIKANQVSFMELQKSFRCLKNFS